MPSASVAEPILVEPMINATSPVGAVVPAEEVTVAVRQIV